MSIIFLCVGLILSTLHGHFDAKPLYHKEVKSFHVDFEVRNIIVSPDDSRLLLVNHERSELWTIDGKRIAAFDFPVSQIDRDIRFSADGKTVIATNYLTIHKCWDASNGNPLGHQMAVEEQIHRLLYALAWRLLEPVRKPNETNKEFEMREGQFGTGMAFLFVLMHPWLNTPLGISDESQYVLSCMTFGDFPIHGTPFLQIWDIKTGQPGKRFLPSNLPLTILECCRLFDRIEAYVVPMYNMVRSCFPAIQRSVMNNPAVNGITFLSDPRFDKSANKWYIRFFNWALRSDLHLPIADHFSLFNLEGANGIAYAPSAMTKDGRWFAHCYGSPSVRIWDLTTGQTSHVLPTQWANQMQFDSTGKTLLVESSKDYESDFHLSRWDLETKKPLWSKAMPNDEVKKIEISRDDRLAAVTHRSGVVTVWELEGGQLLAIITRTKRGYNSAAFLGHGQKLVTAKSLDDQRTRIQIWE